MKLPREAMADSFLLGSGKGAKDLSELLKRLKDFVNLNTDYELAVSVAELNRRYSGTFKRLGSDFRFIMSELIRADESISVFKHKGKTWLASGDKLKERVELALNITKFDSHGEKLTEDPEIIRERIQRIWADNAMED